VLRRVLCLVACLAWKIGAEKLDRVGRVGAGMLAD
jgi:hypothetical protein